MRSSSLRMWIALAAGLAAVACSSRADRDGPRAKEPPAPSSTQPQTLKLEPSPTHTMFQPPPELPQHRELVLEAPGKGPRRILRYQPDQAMRELVIGARIESRELADGTWGPRVALPELRYGLGVGPVQIEAEGAPLVPLRGLVATIGEVPASAAGDAKLAEHLRGVAANFLAHYRANVERRRVSARIDERGFLRALSVTPDAAAAAREVRSEFEQLLLESVVPLPAEPVGKGARWRAVTLMRRNAAMVTQTATYEIVELKKDRIRLAVELTQLGEHQIVGVEPPAPGRPGPVTAELVALFWQAHGELTITMAAFTPLAGALDVELRVHTRVVRPARTTDYFIESMGKVELVAR